MKWASRLTGSPFLMVMVVVLVNEVLYLPRELRAIVDQFLSSLRERRALPEPLSTAAETRAIGTEVLPLATEVPSASHQIPDTPQSNV
jgi:hypothetical protein